MSTIEEAAKEYADAVADLRALEAERDRLHAQEREFSDQAQAITNRIRGTFDRSKHVFGWAYDGVEDRVIQARAALLKVAAADGLPPPDPGNEMAIQASRIEAFRRNPKRKKRARR